MRFSRDVLICVAVLAQCCFAFLSYAESPEDEKGLKLEVIDPYVEIHTGPGRGYPVFHVIEQGEYIHVLTRRPDWYEIIDRRGRKGWAKASQISRTLQPTGEPVDLPTVSYGDYQKKSVRIGFSAGPFNEGELKGSDTFSLNIGYRPFSWLSLDYERGNFYGSGDRGTLSSFNIVLEPFSRFKVAPVLVLGTGSLSITKQPKLPDQTAFDEGSYDFSTYGLGLHYYIGRNFLVRGEYRLYNVSTDEPRDEQLNTWKLGFSTFF